MCFAIPLLSTFSLSMFSASIFSFSTFSYFFFGIFRQSRNISPKSKGWEILNKHGCRASEALSNTLRHYIDQFGFLEKPTFDSARQFLAKTGINFFVTHIKFNMVRCAFLRGFRISPWN
jgi:hypothetical protein